MMCRGFSEMQKERVKKVEKYRCERCIITSCEKQGKKRTKKTLKRLTIEKALLRQWDGGGRQGEMRSSMDHPERQQKRGRRRKQTVVGRSGVAIQFAV